MTQPMINTFPNLEDILLFIISSKPDIVVDLVFQSLRKLFFNLDPLEISFLSLILIKNLRSLVKKSLWPVFINLEPQWKGRILLLLTKWKIVNIFDNFFFLRLPLMKKESILIFIFWQPRLTTEIQLKNRKIFRFLRNKTIDDFCHGLQSQFLSCPWQLKFLNQLN